MPCRNWLCCWGSVLALLLAGRRRRFCRSLSTPVGGSSGRSNPPVRAHDALFQNRVLGVDFNQRYVIGPEIGEMLKHAPGVRFVELGALHHDMAQHQAAVARQIDVNDLDVGIAISDVILPRQFATNPAVAARIMDRIDPDAGAFLRIVMRGSSKSGWNTTLVWDCRNSRKLPSESRPCSCNRFMMR